MSVVATDAIKYMCCLTQNFSTDTSKARQKNSSSIFNSTSQKRCFKKSVFVILCCENCLIMSHFSFNDGNITRVKTMGLLGITSGNLMREGLQHFGDRRSETAANAAQNSR